MLHISLSGEQLFTIGSFSVTNTILTTWVVMGILILLSLFIKLALANIPSRGQIVVEAVVGGLYNMLEPIMGTPKQTVFSFFATFFIFIIASNWFGLLPGVGSIKVAVKEDQSALTEPVHEDKAGGGEKVASGDKEPSEESHSSYVPLFRAPTADLNTTLALAIVAMALIQYYGMQSLGTGIYLKKFIDFSNPINFYVGILEIISELSKIISFSFRLFGNIFAGEVLLTIIAFLIPIVAPIPFIGLEIFVGFIQALVFSMLFAVFTAVATTKSH